MSVLAVEISVLLCTTLIALREAQTGLIELTGAPLEVARAEINLTRLKTKRLILIAALAGIDKWLAVRSRDRTTTVSSRASSAGSCGHRRRRGSQSDTAARSSPRS